MPSNIASPNIVTLTSENFEQEVAKSNTPVVVDFWAEWCGPCKMIAPSLEEISVEMEGKIKVAKLNIDENPELAAQFGVRSIPTLAIYRQILAPLYPGKRIDCMLVYTENASLYTLSEKALGLALAGLKTK